MSNKKQQAISKLTSLEAALPYGSKKKIAVSLKENRHNVQTAFRGMAGEKLTIKVLKRAVKLFPESAQQAKVSLN